MTHVLLGAVALGLLWSLTAMGVFITYRVLTIPDLTTEGSIVLGASVVAISITAGVNPYLATFMAMIAGLSAGIVTGLLHTKLGIPALLSGILNMVALYSINLRVMGSANVTLLRMRTVFTVFIDMGFTRHIATIMKGSIFVALVIVVINWFFRTEIGSSIRATGNNQAMARAQGINTDTALIMGLAIGNGLIGLSGGLIAQFMQFSDINMGIGSIVIALASVIIGEVLIGKNYFLQSLVANVFGAVTYRIIIALVLQAGMPATDLRLFTAITVVIALCLPHIKTKYAETAKRIERSKNVAKGGK